jgi:hypothetical protein
MTSTDNTDDREIVTTRVRGDGFGRVRRAAETPFNRILVARP